MEQSLMDKLTILADSAKYDGAHQAVFELTRS